MIRPVSVEPVNEISRTSECPTRAAPGSAFDVYLNLPAGMAPDPERALYFVGRLSFFGGARQILSRTNKCFGRLDPCFEGTSIQLSEAVGESFQCEVIRPSGLQLRDYICGSDQCRAPLISTQLAVFNHGQHRGLPTRGSE